MTRPNYRKLFIGISVLLALVATTRVDAYELATHARLTLEAFNRSILADSQFLKNLGIDSMVLDSSGYALNPFGTIYYDVSGSAINERQANPNGVTFDARFLGLSTENPDQTFIFPAWLMRGAIREDDVLEPDNGQPVEDPYNTGNALLDNRVLNHFYDPVHDWPLTVGMVLGKKAPDWVSGTNDVFIQPNTPESGRRNHFTVFDAREAMYRALTGKSKEGDDVAPTKDDRNKYWATLFRALGDIVHLVEDMAQPQHTRNDPHAGKKYDGNPGVRGHKSLYEAYIETRAAAKEFELPSGDKFIPPQLNYTGYDTPRFTDYLSYFTTRQVDSDVMARRGLADYSNRGFFSAGKNLNPFDDAQYDYPSNNAPSYGRLPVTTNWLGQPFGGTMTLFIGSVSDSFTGQTDTGVPLTAIGAWDQFLEQKNLFLISRYTLVRDNYDAMADRLIPRAVAYSAGFMDYFFRGRVEAEEVTFVDEAITLKVKNAIDVKKFPDYANEKLYNGGKFVVTREYKVGEEKRLDASEPVLMEEDIEPGKISQQSYTFSFPTTLLQGVGSVKFRLVFRGQLGQEEDAVVAGAIRPLSGFIVTPNYVPADGLGGSRQIYRYANQWMLSDETGLVAGNIDWKGGYDQTTHKPTKTLSWRGPSARYFPDWQAPKTGDGPFTPEVYQGGELYALAPHPVLGAAIARDSEDGEWLVVVCKDNVTDVIYRRPNRKSDNPALYHPSDNPDGWREMARYAYTANDFWEADRPWFFNGIGTEAQTMRRGYKSIPGVGNQQMLYRLVIDNIDLTAGTAQFSGPEENTLVLTTSSESKECQDDSTVDPDSVCVGDCEGVKTARGNLTETYTTTGSGGGEMVVAVDYKENGPVYAMYSVQAGGSTVFQEKTNSQSSTVCGRDSYGGVNYCASPSNYSLVKYTRTAEDKPDLTEVIRLTDGTTATLSSRTGTRHTTYTSQQESIGGLVTNSSSVDVHADYTDTQGYIQYMDLRTGAIYAFRQDIRTTASGSADPASSEFGGLMPALVTARSSQLLHQAENTIVLHENPEDNINTLVNEVFPRTFSVLLGRGTDVVKTEGDVSYIAIYGASSMPGQDLSCGSSQGHNSYWSEEIHSISSNMGEWAADSNKNLLASVVAKDYSPLRNLNRYFSYLTAGDLKVIIPMAPESPRYSSIGVIH